MFALSLLIGGAMAQAASVTGSVTDKTTGKPAAGDAVVLVEPMTGMSEVGRTTSDAQGRYTLNLPGSNPYLIRVTHQGADYFIPAPQGGGTGDISVYDVAAKVEAVTIEEHVTGVESDNGQLRVVERYEVHNASAPPRTQWSKRSFEVILPQDAVLGEASAQRPGTGSLPTSVKLDQDGPKGHYSFNFPIQPDEGGKGTLFQVQYELPYSSGKYSFQSLVTLPAQTVWVVLPKSMTFTGGSGSGFESSPQDPTVQTFLTRDVTPGKAVEFAVSGTGSFSRDDQNGQGGQPGDNGPEASAPGNGPGGGIGQPINTPGPLDQHQFLGVSLKWWLLILMAVVLAFLAGFMLRKPTVPAGSLKERYEDAYRVARGIIFLGTVVKFCAAALGGIIVIAGIAASSSESSLVSGGVIVFGIVVGLLGFASGVLVSAQGQIMLSMIDTSVNTSPLVGELEKARIIGVPAAGAPGKDVTQNSRDGSV